MTLGQPGPDRSPDAPEPSVGVGAPDAERQPAGDPVKPHGRTDMDGEGGAHRPRRRRLTFWQELPLLVIAALVLAVLIKAFVVQAFYIPSGSMERTLHGCPGCHGDRVLVNKMVYDFRGIHRGDIVVFDGKDNYHDVPAPTSSGNPVVNAVRQVADWIGLAPEGTDYIKRVIGLPGDHVMCCDARGRVVVNGHSLTEPYVYTDGPDDHKTFNVVVPAGKIWVMGDHRNLSYDSRDVGAIPEDDVLGRAFAIIWPPSRVRWFSTPATFSGVPKSAADAAPLLLSIAVVSGVTVVRRRRRRTADRP